MSPAPPDATRSALASSRGGGFLRCVHFVCSLSVGMNMTPTAMSTVSLYQVLYAGKFRIFGKFSGGRLQAMNNQTVKASSVPGLRGYGGGVMVFTCPAKHCGRLVETKGGVIQRHRARNLPDDCELSGVTVVNDLKGKV